MKIDYDQWKNRGLGTKPDSVIAKQYGVGRRYVAYIRNRLGIGPFIGLILTQEGFPCRSILEAKYDAVLHWKGIKHQHEVCVVKPYIADFLVGKRLIEILGMERFKRYADKYKKKHAAYDKACVEITYLSTAAVEYEYKDCPIPLKFRDRFCIKCGKNNHDLVKGLCRTPCYMDKWHRSRPEKKCLTCGKTFSKDGKYCSRACYWKSLAVENPSPGTVYMRKRRGGLYEERRG